MRDSERCIEWEHDDGFCCMKTPCAYAAKQEPVYGPCVKCGYVGPASKANAKSGWNQCGRRGRLQSDSDRANAPSSEEQS
jgi:hypothetical protein